MFTDSLKINNNKTIHTKHPWGFCPYYDVAFSMDKLNKLK